MYLFHTGYPEHPVEAFKHGCMRVLGLLYAGSGSFASFYVTVLKQVSTRDNCQIRQAFWVMQNKQFIIYLLFMEDED
jgi:hypothetical protein